MKPIKYIESGEVITMTEWAKGMKNVLAVVTEADGSEGLRTVDQLKKLDKVEEPKAEPKPKSTPRCRSGAKRKKQTPRRDNRLAEYAGHCAAGTDPVTAGVASGLFDRLNEPIKMDWGRMYGPKDLVPFGEALWWGASMIFLLWWIVKFAI